MQVFAYKMCNFLKKVFQCPPIQSDFSFPLPLRMSGIGGPDGKFIPADERRRIRRRKLSRGRPSWFSYRGRCLSGR